MEFANRDNRRIERGNVAADDNLQRIDNRSAHNDGVDALVGHGAMRASARDINAEPVAIRHARPRFGGNGTRFHFAPNMSSINGIHPIERTFSNHLARTDRYLFRRLEQDTHLAMQLVSNAQKQVNSAEHHCHVTVVATGMHNPFVPRHTHRARYL